MKSIKDYKQKWFDFTDYEPHPGQKNLHFPPKGTRFTVACCGRRWGKSFSAAKEVEVVVTQKDKHVWIVAPTYSTSERIFRIVYDDMIIKHNLPTKRKSLKEQFIEFEWGSFVAGKSAEHPDSLIGEGLDLVIIDEAAKVNRKIWDAYIRPTLSDRKGNAIFVSTPEGYGQFWELYLRGNKEKNWYSFNSPSWENNFAFPKGENDIDLIEAKSNLNTEIFDQGDDFSGNTFTAPVTGKYQLSFATKILNVDTAATYYAFYINTSNRVYTTQLDPATMFTADVPYMTFTWSGLVDMDALDTAWITWKQFGGSEQADLEGGVSSSFSTFFSGYLVC